MVQGPDRAGRLSGRAPLPRRRGARAQASPARQLVGDIHRQRMLIAIAEAVGELGIASVSVAEVVARAGVSRRTFYEAFEDRNDCLLAALDFAVERAAQRALPAWREHGEWREAIRGALAELLCFIDEEPVLGALLVVDWPAAWGLAVERRAQLTRALVEAVAAGRALSRAGSPPSTLTAEGVVGAVLAVLRARMLPEREGVGASGGANGAAPAGAGASALLGELMAIVVLPYLGAAAAAREARRPLPEPPRAPASGGSDALRGLKIRLTYRTVMVLRAIGEHEGASNREIAAAAGIADQGQVSKLLARLARAGLIANARDGAGPRECNSWSLTPSGAAVERATSRDGRPRVLAGASAARAASRPPRTGA
ncbi:MAG: TetR family transcriptional regulator [Solirubrobacteraceae bacterium]